MEIRVTIPILVVATMGFKSVLSPTVDAKTESLAPAHKIPNLVI